MYTTIILLIIGSTIILSLFKWLYEIWGFRKLINLIPGPNDHYYPFIGHLLAFCLSADQLWNCFRKLALDYYPIYKYWQMYVPVVAILSPEDMEIVLSSTKNARKSEIYNVLHAWLGTGLLTSAGTKWQQRRKILTPSFHFNILQQFLSVFIEESQRLVEQLEEECLKSYTDLVPLISPFTLNTICETAMGTRLEKTDKETQKYIKAIFGMGQIGLQRLICPWKFPEGLFMLMPEYRQQRQLLKTLHNFSESVIRERKANFKEPNSVQQEREGEIGIYKKRRMAMLDLLISAEKSGEFIDDEGIREEVDTFMFEGHDTTTACICFTLFALATHIDIQERVLEELQDVFSDSKRAPTYQDLQSLPYLDQVLKESLRMYPSVPFISRVVDEEITTHSGYVLPPTTILEIHIYDMHHNPNVYPEPEKFDPERFSPENTSKRHPFAYLPFSAGSRNCIGQRFAVLEIKTVISTILRNFVVEAVDKPSDIKYICHFILACKSGIKIRFKKREV